jgi:asparagine synthase (glutamine-hydrolysing)
MNENLGVLFSGGKDSNYVTYIAQSTGNTISCLITLSSKNPNSYMFQSVGNNIIDFQAKAMNIPLLRIETLGEKEKELEDLKKALILAKKKYNITGICTGAIKSAYQASRIQKICLELNLSCYNPIWQIDEDEYMDKLLENKFEISIFGIFSYPFQKSMLTKIINQKELNKLKQLRTEFEISIAGEGGEYESFILDAPMYKQKLKLSNIKTEMDSENSGIITKCDVELINKEENIK